ncbi:ABC transporter substrate-binding protein [Legionella norrlandica]|uniref:ABC transporter substrate-binding protein n=1 Tax=Legionella norrlandica TaxID=1498499 RepID=A0A0A2T4X5_9GAMM|nr:transporter substrate-binding domain-containing protein [Legionella norrlandica]KGP62463.1 ABC transporter substrate-binding protein [Legionella norrlandica]
MVRLRVYLCFLILIIPFYKLYALSLTIGTLSYNPPYEVQLTNTKKEEFYGFDIDIMDEVCRRIQAKCQFKAILFSDIFTQINTGEIDLAIGTISITPERSENYLFSLPYKTSYSQFLTLANSNIKKVDDLKGKIIGVYKGSPTADFVTAYFNNDIQLKFYETAEEILNALDKQEVNAIITNTEQVNYWADNISNYKLIGNSFPIDAGYGIMAQLGQEELIEKINQALIDMENDGTYLKIYNLSF